MKSIYFISMAFIFSYLKINAQSSNFSIGPKLGINFSNVNRDNTKNKIGINAGLTTTYSVNETSGIGLDILYSRQGFKDNGINTNLDYLKFPLIYKLFFNNLGDAFRPRLELGISPGFLLSAKTNEFSFKNQLNSFDLGFIGGLGFNYRLSDRLWLNFDLRADLGLLDITKDSSSSLKNRSTSINVGIAAGL